MSLRNLLWAPLVFGAVHANSQGCNDAGFCTMGDLKSVGLADSSRTTVGWSTFVRLGEKETLWASFQAEASWKPWSSGKISGQVPVHLITGQLGTIAGMGDVALSFSQRVYSADSTSWSLTAGVRWPPTSGNQLRKNEPLPMAYQPSQGTNDVVVGITYRYDAWYISAGWQHNLGANGNEYVDSLRTYATDVQFYDSRHIDRGDDVLLRIERLIHRQKKASYIVGILPIYRLQEATIATRTGERIPVDGSSGLTINLNAGLAQSFGDHGKMKLLVGVPAITRHVRPDGLTGTFVISCSLDWNL